VNSSKYKFDIILDFAKEVLKENERNKVNYKVHVVRLVGRKIQTDNMVNLIENISNESDLRVENLYNLSFYSDDKDDNYINECIVRINQH
jgi:Ran GTPase-activating protein (RanGAP) involved in mRNA processing and transport